MLWSPSTVSSACWCSHIRSFLKAPQSSTGASMFFFSTTADLQTILLPFFVFHPCKNACWILDEMPQLSKYLKAYYWTKAARHIVVTKDDAADLPSSSTGQDGPYISLAELAEKLQLLEQEETFNSQANKTEVDLPKRNTVGKAIIVRSTHPIVPDNNNVPPGSPALSGDGERVKLTPHLDDISDPYASQDFAAQCGVHLREEEETIPASQHCQDIGRLADEGMHRRLRNRGDGTMMDRAAELASKNNLDPRGTRTTKIAATRK